MTPSTLALTYDPLGRLHSSTAGGVTTEFLYDGDALVAEYSSGGTLQRRYVHGAGVDEPLVWYEGVGLTDRRWLHADHLGTIIVATDSSGARTGSRYMYGPYGEPDSWSGVRFRYTGQAMLPEVQLYHYKARVYDPVLGRFLQIDPVRYQDDLNMYAYVRNSPMNGRDPRGAEVNLTGTDKDRAEFIRIAERATNVPLSEVDGKLVAGDTSDVTLGPGADTMLSAINSPNAISIITVRDNPGVFGDLFATNEVDVADLAAFQNRDANFGAAMLAHVFAERLDAATYGSQFRQAHQAGLAAENRIMGATDRVVTTNPPGSQPLPGVQITLQYRDASQTVLSSMVFRLDANNGTPY